MKRSCLAIARCKIYFQAYWRLPCTGVHLAELPFDDCAGDIMQGALPLEGLPPTWRTRVVIAPYATHTVELPFYFPHPGTCTHHLDQSDRTTRLVACCCV